MEIEQIDQNHVNVHSAASISWFSNARERIHSSLKHPLTSELLAEIWGTFFMVVLGVGSVCSAVLSKSLVGIWQVASVWGFGVALAIYATASISGAHLNPAVSLAFAILRPNGFAWYKLIPYICAQVIGAMLGGVVNLVVFYDLIVRFERVNGIVDRTAPNGVLSAMIFGEYTPNPGIFGAGEDFQELYSPLSGMFIEMLGTMILMFMILALTDDRQRALVHKDLAPLLIGFTVAVLIAVYGPITQAGWNPARDFGPRFIAWIAGWGKTAIPGPRNDFWVYIIGPMIGAPLGGFLYDKTLAKGLPEMIVKMDYCKIVDECRDESKIA